MQYPTPGAYQEALQFPETAFLDEELKQGTPEETTLGLPRAVTGAFAAVFPVDTRGGRRAVKCFLNEVGDQKKRYRAIAAHLEAHDLPSMVAFDYQPQGVRVDGAVYPIVKMEWVQGTPLNRFVEEHREQSDVMSELSRCWLALMSDLEAADLAHGDLQHGNVIVSRKGDVIRLRLVDYDTMYVPALDGRRSAEVGHRNYQHPDRNESDFGPYLDHFSGIVIFTALEACRRRPDLWGQYDTGENLLFRAEDFYDPGGSVLMETLQGEESLRPFVETLRTACYLEPETVPPLSRVVAGEWRPALAGRLQQYVRRGRRNREPERPAHDVRSRTARLFLPALTLLAAAAAALLLMVGWEPAAAMLAAGALGAGWVARRGYRRLPAVRRRRRLRQEVTYFERLIDDLERQIETRKAQRSEVLSNVESLREERLRERREEALYDRLKYHFVNEVKQVEGVGHRVVVRLKAAGIRTAYECTPEQLADVRGIGDRSRARVAMWRSGLVAEYEDAVPDELSPADERRLERYVKRRAAGLEEDMQRAREKIRVQEEEKAQVGQRLETIPAVGWRTYLRYLLRLGELPRRAVQPAPPRQDFDGSDDGQKETAPVPAVDPDRAWWERGREKGRIGETENGGGRG